MNRVMELLRRLDFQCCGVYLIDASFTLDSAKLMSGMLAALSAMIKLEVAHINVLSKCDLVVSFWRGGAVQSEGTTCTVRHSAIK